MNTPDSKRRISKACQECRTRKIKCNGQTPCQSCRLRGWSCAYREKARNRIRRTRPVDVSEHSRTSHESVESGSDTPATHTQIPYTESAASASAPAASHSGGGEQSINTTSVAATHRASPSCLLELYYGPSSNFALLNCIYHQINGTRPRSPPPTQDHEGLDEVGPGLDLFRHRRLFFGDLTDSRQKSFSTTASSQDFTAMLLDPTTARRLLERFLVTYWHVVPALDKDVYRRRLDELFRPPGIFDFDSPETIILMLALALGATMLGEEATAEFLFHKSKQGAAKLDEVVNMQVIQIHLMMSLHQAEVAKPNAAFLHVGNAVRKAIAAGLHKRASGHSSQTLQDMKQRRLLFWSLFVWETWHCFTVGRPSSIPDPGSDNLVPHDSEVLAALVALSRIMSKCVNLIYAPRHDSLLPVWNAAMQLRRELHQFAEKQSKDMKFGLVGDAGTGELGVCQAMVSTMYHHTLLLTFRPFLILRAKLKQESSTSDPPPWLDTACEYCLEAARNMLSFLAGSYATNPICGDIAYHGFFIEGACYTLAFDMLQDSVSANRNLPWIHAGLGCLRTMISKRKDSKGQVLITSDAIKQMVQSVYPNLDLEGGGVSGAAADASSQPKQQDQDGAFPMAPSAPAGMIPNMASTFPSLPFGFDVNGNGTVNDALPSMRSDEQMDFTAADVGWDIDFGTMDMEAFFSLDANQPFDVAS